MNRAIGVCRILIFPRNNNGAPVSAVIYFRKDISRQRP